ncbi:dual 3',5'-cyclic-AMP and -GMP phosphodiesterase 11-like isoform X2 [Antedon mediterranea]|uniref:dual 3',5'-cyclic-AMP and -GMP phosphodiesterase 11-like isoform X2 n=1 Tax=Antedon mediterranea TaxID=105859 RepID=UPI003AF4EF8E
MVVEGTCHYQTEKRPKMAASDTSSQSMASQSKTADAPQTSFEEIEIWLDQHPEFTHDYFARKATRSMIDGWYIATAVSQGVKPAAGDVNHSPNSSSGSNTPVRKVSASDFELREAGGSLGRMVQTVDGSPSFLGPSVTHQGKLSPPVRSRNSINELKQLEDRRILMELVKDIANDLDQNSLCHKILQNVLILTRADRGSLFLVQGKGTENCLLVSKLFDVTIDSTVEESVGKEIVKVAWGKGIVGYVAKTGETVNIANAYEDSRFNCEVDLCTGYKTRSMLSMPIKDPSGEVIGVAEVINKLGGIDKPEAFDETDEQVFEQYLQFCGIGINNARLYQRAMLEVKRNKVLLDLARVIFEEQSTLSSIMRRILELTISLLRCERCSILLVDESPRGIFSQVYELGTSDLENKGQNINSSSTGSSCRFPVHMGITGFVATTGQTLNISDAYNEPKFDSKCDEQTGFRTKQMLCMPIRNANGTIVGVSLLVNKIDGVAFNKNDEEMFEAFAIFCGLGITNTHMYENACRAVAKQRVALETLSYHATASQEEALRLKKMSIPSNTELGLAKFSFNELRFTEDDMLIAGIRMFHELDFFNKFRINYETMCRWLLSVRKNYRNVTYHNWKHAFSVSQTMFAILKTGQLCNVISDLECMALLVACFCHDLDHRGTNNKYQIMTESSLAQLYSTSVMEHHHFDQCIMILNSKGCEIFNNLSPEDYSQVTRLVEHAILSTDLAVYFKSRGDFFNLVKSKDCDWCDEENREILRGMLMTACDVSAISKPWEVQKEVAELVSGEFFEQGDLERKLNVEPEDMMNREKHHLLPKMQVSFIDAICLPIYKALTIGFEKLYPLKKGTEENRENWLKEGRKVGISGLKEKGVTDEKDVDESEATSSSKH